MNPEQQLCLHSRFVSLSDNTAPTSVVCVFPVTIPSWLSAHQSPSVWTSLVQTSEWIFGCCPSNGIRGSRKPPDQRQRSISLSLQTDLAVQSSSCRGLGNHSNHLERTVCSHPTASIISQVYVKLFFPPLKPCDSLLSLWWRSNPSVSYKWIYSFKCFSVFVFLFLRTGMRVHF